MSKPVRKKSGPVEGSSRAEVTSNRSSIKGRRMLPQLPNTNNNNHTAVAMGNDTTLDLTTVSELSDISLSSNMTDSSLGAGLVNGTPVREFVSPVKFTTDGEDSCVTVAVRVRPFSQRELLLKTKPVIRMHGNETIIKSKDGVVHRFYYDHCFWSIPDNLPGEGVASGRGLTPKFSTQESVYQELAQPLLDRSFEGYNTCLFAYGQTGSGKSYCIMGEGDALGVVPRFAQELFDRVEGTVDDETSYKVQVSFYEIYKERIHDLLASNQQRVKKKLKVREHPVLGPYVEDLSTFVADSYSDIERWIHVGNRFRATAATGMNERSSRSHSVFTITLTQTSTFEGEEQSKVSRINLIDLAGSERSSVSKTSGERLKEGASINKSLHSLGKVISLLSEKGSGRRKKVFIPYRDSSLTWLLKESLGGNSKTAMIATISPSDLHYEESLSTLRYAQQARTIVNVARINEDPNGAVIRDLRQQIDELRALLFTGRTQQTGDDSLVKGLQEKLLESEKLMSETTRSWQEKLRASEARKMEEMEQLKQSGALTVNNHLPNLVNLTEDPQLSEMLLYVLKEGVTRIGRRAESGSHDIELSGALVMSDHCSIENTSDVVTLHPSTNTEAQTYLNGNIMTSSTQIHHGDRIVLGGEYFFRFNLPIEVEKGVHIRKGQGSFEYAKNELIRAQTARLESELEEKRLAERQAMMAELQAMKDEAQKDIDQQREDYEGKLAELARDMAEQSMEVTHVQKFNEEAQQKLEELLQRNRALEEETMTQKHVIHLEKLKAEREFEDIREQKTRLMSDLEQEKNKLLSDITHLNKNKSLRVNTSGRRDSTLSLSGEPSMRGSELVRLAMMLQEASSICKSLNKPLTFSREELAGDSGSTEVQVRVNNTQQGLVTFWSLDKFESRLEMMRDMYQTLPPTPLGSVTSLEGESVGSYEEGDPFTDPGDTWVKETLLTPHPSPLRSSHVRTLLSSNTSTTVPTPITSLPPRSLMDILNNSFSSRGASPILRNDTDSLVRCPSYPQLHQSLASVCYKQISGLLNLTLTFQERSPFQSILKHIVAIREASSFLEEAFDKYSPQPDVTAPFSSIPEVTQTTLSLYTSLELLLSEGRSLHRDLSMWESLLTRVVPGGEEGLLRKKAEGLLETICQQTALYCSKLLQGVDKETEHTIKESCSSLKESLDSLTQQTGGLCLARRVMDKTLQSRVHATPPSSEGGEDDFLSLQMYQKSAVLFYQGHIDWCTLTFDLVHQSVKDCLDTITDNYNVDDLIGGVVKVIRGVVSFLQRLTEMQVDIWNLNNPESNDGTLPVIPSLTHVVDLLAHLRQVKKSINTLTEHTRELVNNSSTDLERLSSSNGQVAYCCNELAAIVLTVIKNSPCDQSQDLISTVQHLSHEIARAGKSVNHIIKKGRFKSGGISRGSEISEHRPAKPRILPVIEMVQTEPLECVPLGSPVVEEVNSSTVAKGSGESRTSMATGQLTLSPEHVSPNANHVTSNEDHVTMKPDMYSNLIDDEDEDSTLI